MEQVCKICCGIRRILNMSLPTLIFSILMASFYVFAGFMHFKNPLFFLKITPRWAPYPELVNKIVGALEIILGICVLVPSTRSIAAIGIIVLLILVFPANIYHFQKALRKKKMIWVTLLRLPLQLLLIWWAYSYI